MIIELPSGAINLWFLISETQHQNVKVHRMKTEGETYKADLNTSVFMATWPPVSNVFNYDRWKQMGIGPQLEAERVTCFSQAHRVDDVLLNVD